MYQHWPGLLYSHFGMILGRPSISPGKISLTSKGRPFHQQLGFPDVQEKTLPGRISPDLTLETLVCRISLRCFGLYFTFWNGFVSFTMFYSESWMSYNYNLLISRIWDAHGEWTCYGIYMNLNGFELMLLVQWDVVWLRGAQLVSTQARSDWTEKLVFHSCDFLLCFFFLKNTQPPKYPSCIQYIYFISIPHI